MLLDEQLDPRGRAVATLDIEATLAQNAINAALKAIATTVNLVKFPLRSSARS
jgi:hypothetical protein